MDALTRRIRKVFVGLSGVQAGESVFSDGEGFWVNGKQIAHFLVDAGLELRLTKPVISAHRQRLKADPRIELRRGASDWIIVRYESSKDLPLVEELAKLAVGAHAPPKGQPVKPPPTGADLERRRRFH
jgi:hypothetical protein